MKNILSLLCIGLALSASCTEKQDDHHTSAKETEQTNIDLDEDSEVAEESETEELPNTRFGKSEIINSKFDPKLLFGVWTLSQDDPACSFELNEKRLLLCDYDGNGERLYRIVNDSILLDNPSLIFRGKILKASKDTLVIHWQENKQPEVLLRMKN